MSHLILSASMHSTEPDPSAPVEPVVTVPGYQHSQFVLPGHTAGGNVTFDLIPIPAGVNDSRPLAVHVYIIPVVDLPADLTTLNPEFFTTRGNDAAGNPLPPFANIVEPIPTAPADGTDPTFAVVVPAVPFGPVFVQLIDEYSS